MHVHAVAHGPLSQAGSTLVWYSIAGMLSASVGASMLPVAKYAWERWEHLLAPKQERERAAQVLANSVACTPLAPCTATAPCCSLMPPVLICWRCFE